MCQYIKCLISLPIGLKVVYDSFIETNTMINYEIKSHLAKLLATENMVVENRNVETAQFDVEKRILTLPMWKRASNVVYDMLVGHEVGHALFTPNDWSWEDRVPKQFVNVVEDARIEKLMKRRYPGLSKSFYKGYQELSDKDFFDLQETNIDEMNLADRANLYFKIGNFIDIPFTSEEKEILTMMSETETFADAVMVAEVLYKYCKGERNEKIENISLPNPNGNTQSSEEDTEESQESVETEETSNSIEESQSGGTSEGERDKSSTSTNEEPKVQTDSMFEEGTAEFNGNLESGRGTNYLEIPKIDTDKVIISNKRIHKELEEYWADCSTPKEYYCAYRKENRVSPPKDFSGPDGEFTKFKKSSNKEVNYLVKEFECKKSADAYSRSFTSKTGTLDCTKLHTYKYNEDLFKKVNVIPNGKNHGLIFILDWSGSMSNCLTETIKQLYNLIWFCSKVNIPFDVYAFTNNYIQEGRESYKESTIQEVKEYDFIVPPDFNLLHFFSSDVSRRDLDSHMKSVWRLVASLCTWVEYSTPNGYNLSGTPLNETIICLHEIIPQFKKKYAVQKVNVVILTDGESNALPYYKNYEYNGKENVGANRTYTGDYIRNRKTGHTYKIEYEYYKFTELLLNDLKQVHPDVNTIGIRISAPGDFKSFIRKYNKNLTEESYKKMRKEKSVAIKTSGYTSYFGILSTALDNQTDFDVEEGASKSKIKAAFVKNLNSKSLNKKVLSQFVDIIS